MRFFVWCLMFSSGIVLSGCITTIGQYGDAPNVGSVELGSTRVHLPQNAPSISQQYHKIPDGRERDKSSSEHEHLGLDFIAKLGTPVIAPADGRVIKSFNEPMYGNTLIVDHGVDQNGRKIQTIYKHLQKRVAKIGDVVVRGQQIGKLGKTGVLSAGLNHLHFEIYRENDSGHMEVVDPNLYWVRGAGKVTCFSKSSNWPDLPFRITHPVVCKDI